MSQSHDNRPSASGNGKKPYAYSTLKEAMRASTGAFVATGIFSFFINMLMLTGPLFMLQIYDRVLTSRSIPTLLLLVALVTGLFAFLGFLEFIRSRILTRIGGNIFQRIHVRVFDAVMFLSLRTGGGSNSTKPLQDLNTVQQYISGPGPSSLFDAPWVPLYIAIIFAFHWWMGILAIVAAILLFIIAMLNDLRAREPTKMAGQASGASNQFADAGRRNAEVLSAMGMLSDIRQRWQGKQYEALQHQTIGRDRASTLTSISKALRLFLQSAMLALGAYLTIQQEVSAGTMIASSIILGRALQPVEQAIAHWRGLVMARTAYHSLNALLGKMANDKEKMPLPAPKGHIDVRGLAIAAPGTRTPILRNVNFSIKPGKILAIIGQSGGGKSTLARSLVGVWPPLAGEVRIDDATHDQWNPELLGRYIGYLSQDVELFGGQINENIARFQPSFDENDVIRAAGLAGVDRLIKHLGGYDADIGHLGAGLSAGQRQRIALARAMYRDPPIIVLDEPNSNLDENGDRALFMALQAMRKNGQTVIIISHKKNILKISDYVLELQNGQQVDFGPTQEVMPRYIERKRREAGASAAPQMPMGGPPRPRSGPPPASSANGNGASNMQITVGTPQWPGTQHLQAANAPQTPAPKPEEPAK
ncbi:MAG: type I secretion system permease/ATPase [Hyphomicrobiaceae bacterium]|nr:type I secretion system permease/ATPase [Hyphomicrobiaceae bacterium]